MKVISLHLSLALGALMSLVPVNLAEAGLKIYYIRHGEVGSNVAQDWASKPKDQWPIYVGKSSLFTPRGEVQVVNATEKLKLFHYDFIAVSPIWRARQTVLPYLKQTQQRAEIWPELAEFDGFGALLAGSPLPPPSQELLAPGQMISLPEAETNWFTLRPDGRQHYNYQVVGAKSLANAVAVAERTVELIHQQFGGSDKSILLVGHGNSGRLLLEKLLKDDKTWRTALLNTGIWMVEEQADGRFKLRLFNDVPSAPEASPAATRQTD